MAKSTSVKQRRKVQLSVHKGSGYWCKVFKGRRHYFEKVANDPTGTASLDQWLEIKAGRAPVKPRDGIRIGEICNEWLAHKQAKLDADEIVQDTWTEYKHTCALVLASINRELTPGEVQPSDFAGLRSDMAKRYGPVALGKHIGQVRSLFKYAYEAGLIDRPMKFGPGFTKPSAKVLRKKRTDRGQQDFDAAEVRRLLATDNPNWRAMILLGVQAGFGNRDVAELTRGVVDLDAGWIDYPRAKTGTMRRVPLWPETIAAIREVLENQSSDSSLLFAGGRGRDFTDSSHGGNRIAGSFKRVLKSAGFPESGRGFYCLRRTFQTQAEECGDIIAVRAIMGHTDPETDMSARYRQRVNDKRLRQAVDTVRGWLFDGEVSS